MWTAREDRRAKGHMTNDPNDPVLPLGKSSVIVEIAGKTQRLRVSGRANSYDVPLRLSASTTASRVLSTLDQLGAATTPTRPGFTVANRTAS